MNEHISDFFRRLFRALVIVAILVILLNYKFFLANIELSFHRPSDTQNAAAIAQIVQKQKIEPNTLIIPSLKITAPIQYPTEPNEDAFQASLLTGVAHYPGSANPGQLGNCYIFGHSSDYFWSKGQYKTIFATLPLIKKGAQVTISDADGTPYIYDVLSSKIVGPNDLSVLDQYNNSAAYLTLQTSYPVGTALKRFVVLAQLESK